MAQSTSYLEEYMRVIGHEATDEALRWYSELGGAPVFVACTMPRVDDDFARLNKHLSVGAAIQNMLLAVTEEGLGSCSITFSYWVRDQIAEILGVPDDRVIVAVVVLGYAGEQQVPESPPKNTDVAVYVD
jgi:nitroreductase